MHTNEVDTSVSLVERLLTEQFPQWANLPIKPVASAGTDAAIFRLGTEMSVRLPRIGWALYQIDKEQAWLPKLAPQLPLSIPEQIAKGQPNAEYPYSWGVYRWLAGKNATIDQVVNPSQTAVQLAQFIKALQKIDTTGGLPAAEYNPRGLPLLHRDKSTREAINALEGIIDTKTATAIWELALQADDWNRPPVWFHGDLLIGNVLFDQGHLSAVIDFGGLAIGDPACDMMIAWSLLSRDSRKVFRNELGVDDATWTRGKGHALSQALMFVPYYINTNPIGVAYAKRAINELLNDHHATA